jgi:hypothetical protein
VTADEYVAKAPSKQMEITLDTRVAVSPEVVLQEVGGEAVLLDLKSESKFGEASGATDA